MIMRGHFQLNKLIKNYSPKEIAVAGVKEIYRKIYLEKIKNSFSQNGEDLLIEKYFPKNFKGKYLEIGAYHPVRLSNTYRFYKKGWRGKVVEPNPDIEHYFEKIRPNDVYIKAGIGDKKGALNYYHFFIPALNTFSKIEAEKLIEEGHGLEKITKINILGVRKIVNFKIDFLSIDTEGFDNQIIKSWPWEKTKPQVICIEKISRQNIKMLENKGYQLREKTPANLIFVRF